MDIDSSSPMNDAFWKFHEENPQVFDELVLLARLAKSKGRDRIGMKMLWERLRWEIFISTTGDEYKLNNNYHSRYARYIMESVPDLAGIFETREHE
jgi:hypothetical protein